MTDSQEHKDAQGLEARASHRLSAHPFRSLLFLSGQSETALKDPGRFEADVLILDLEDGVPSDKKEERRRQISEAAQAAGPAGEPLARLQSEKSAQSLQY